MKKRKVVSGLAIFVATLLTLTFCTVVLALVWPVVTGKQPEASQLAVFVVGNLTGAVCGGIVGFLFGSSEGSRAKDAPAEVPTPTP